MKVQSADLGFGKSSKRNASEKNPNIFAITAGGVISGAAAGLLARKYLPTSDEFFFDLKRNNPNKKQSVQDAVRQFIEEYSLSDIQDARILKTALIKSKAPVLIPEDQNKGITELINEPSIKIIVSSDSEELQSSLKAFETTILKDLTTSDKKEHLENLGNINEMASSLLTKAKRGFHIREHLEHYVKDIKGFSATGKDSPHSIKSKIRNNKEISKPIQDELLQAFNQVTKISQRHLGLWVIIPSAVVGAAAFLLSGNLQKKLFQKSKK